MSRASRIAVADWAAFEDAKIEGYKRAQHRFIGAGGSGKHDDVNAIPPSNFTLSIMFVEPGQGNASHTHEVEEVFFVLRGMLDVFIEDEKGEHIVTRLGPWDCISCPAGVIHGYINSSLEPVYFQVMLGRARPEAMGYADEKALSPARGSPHRGGARRALTRRRLLRQRERWPRRRDLGQELVGHRLAEGREILHHQQERARAADDIVRGNRRAAPPAAGCARRNRRISPRRSLMMARPLMVTPPPPPRRAPSSTARPALLVPSPETSMTRRSALTPLAASCAIAKSMRGADRGAAAEGARRREQRGGERLGAFAVADDRQSTTTCCSSGPAHSTKHQRDGAMRAGLDGAQHFGRLVIALA